MKYIWMVLLLVIGSSINAQEDFNLELVANVPISETGNDIWGYVDSIGNEYAIMGSISDTYIFDIREPANPVLVTKIAGDTSTWRDIKSWDDHIYVTADDGDDGLLVIDMSDAPDTVYHQYIKPNINVGVASTPLGECHNLYIDENGYCYLSGCRISGGNKAIILDLNVDKWNPPVVGIHGGSNIFGQEYSHDLYVQNDIMYASEIYAGEIELYDVSQKDTIIPLGSAVTSFEFTHNAWASNDQNYVFTTDERANAFVDAYDISNLPEVKRIDRFQPLATRGNGVIPHNTHYFDGYLVTSYYTDGVVITDANKPDNLIEVGHYDTYLQADGGFRGCWGAYPYLPSGLVLASDRQTGLYIFNSTYQRASYLEGTITNGKDGSAVNNALITILDTRLNEGISIATGEYKTGVADEGSFDVRITHPDFNDTIINDIVLEPGVVTILDVELGGQFFDIEGTITDIETGLPISDAQILVTNTIRTYELTTDNEGKFSVCSPVDNYQIFAGQWGYITQQLNIQQNVDPSNVSFQLEKGYQDEYILDLGWETTATATSGLWERAVPRQLFFQGIPNSPTMDDENDLGNLCYVTGNGGLDSRDDNVDNGQVRLTSPWFNVSDMNDPVLNFRYFFSNSGGTPPVNDTLFVRIWDMESNTDIAVIVENTPDWSDLVSIPLKDLVNTNNDMFVSFITSDFSATGHLVDAAIDVFSIIDNEIISSNEEILDYGLVMISPNPFDNQVRLEMDSASEFNLLVYNNLGQIVLSKSDVRDGEIIELNGMSGLYIFEFESQDGSIISKKIVKK